MDATAPPIVTPEVRIVDEQGHLRLLLSAKDGIPKYICFVQTADSEARCRLMPTDVPQSNWQISMQMDRQPFSK
jgi:hypothetical protein